MPLAGIVVKAALICWSVLVLLNLTLLRVFFPAVEMDPIKSPVVCPKVSEQREMVGWS